MDILKERAEYEIEVKKSRFLAIACPVTELSAIKDLVHQTRLLHPQANHVVHAAVLGPKGDLYSFSDDHEPKNTAGRPALEVLKGSSVTNILVMVVRYFGGTLLGTGGLVKAYGDSVKEVLKHLKTEPLIEKRSFRLTIPYNLYDVVKILLNDTQTTIDSEDFATEVTISGALPSENTEVLERRIIELSKGSTQPCFIDE
ncbi:MAG: YigZ family protein [Sphaerochaeta sp.]|jgi:uncharacterized YigZ family protein|uniref:YigZ family protein n=1 Tax=Sphaerochaeta sp. TaxID=1972642 RepID=UPI002FC88233